VVQRRVEVRDDAGVKGNAQQVHDDDVRLDLNKEFMQLQQAFSASVEEPPLDEVESIIGGARRAPGAGGQWGEELVALETMAREIGAKTLTSKKPEDRVQPYIAARAAIAAQMSFIKASAKTVKDAQVNLCHEIRRRLTRAAAEGRDSIGAPETIERDWMRHVRETAWTIMDVGLWGYVLEVLFNGNEMTSVDRDILRAALGLAAVAPGNMLAKQATMSIAREIAKINPKDAAIRPLLAIHSGKTSREENDSVLQKQYDALAQDAIDEAGRVIGSLSDAPNLDDKLEDIAHRRDETAARTYSNPNQNIARAIIVAALGWSPVDYARMCMKPGPKQALDTGVRTLEKWMAQQAKSTERGGVVLDSPLMAAIAEQLRYARAALTKKK
jgi:hypothetical protein